MLALRGHIAAIIKQPGFTSIYGSKLPKLREPLQRISSLTIGINLDLNLKPVSAVLMAINGKGVGDAPSLIDKLFGLDEDSDDDLRAIARAHRFPSDSDSRRYDALFQDVDLLMKQTARPIANALNRYVRTKQCESGGAGNGVCVFYVGGVYDDTTNRARDSVLQTGSVAS